MATLEEEVRRLREYEKLHLLLQRKVHGLRSVQSGGTMPLSRDLSENASPSRELRTNSDIVNNCEKHHSADTADDLAGLVFSEPPLNPLHNPQVGVDFVLMQVDMWHPSNYLPRGR